MALAAAFAALAATAPVASATITSAPLTIAQSGDTVSFTIAAPAESPTPDRLIALLVAPAGTGATTVATTMAQGVGAGGAQVTGSTADCQIVNGPNVTPLDLPVPDYVEGTGFTWKIPASVLPTSFDAKAVTADDFVTDACQPAGVDGFGLKVSMADATRWPVPPAPAPVVVPVTPPAPAPVITPAPAPAVPTPAADPDKDGIKNDWLVGGKPVGAPKPAKVARVTAHAATLTLPKAPKNGKLRVYVRVAGKGTFKAVTVKVNKKTGKATMSGLKAHTRYEVKVVAVNQAGQQTQASKPVVVKTAKK